jgi:hypothetical protein
MMTFILATLIPILMAGGLTEPQAREAAQQAIGTPNNLLETAQSVAFALTALDSLRLSAPAEVSLRMKLRLRGNANALNRSAQRTAAAPEPPPAPEPDPKELLTTIQTAKTTVEQAHTSSDKAWASAMTDVAGEFQAELASLPESQKTQHLARIKALTRTATELASGKAPSMKDRLKASTALRQT